MSEGVDFINRKLIDAYGKDVGLSLPNYRIVWSNSQLERRFGTFEDWMGDIWLREVTETREVEKYPLYPDMWILERLMGIDAVNTNIRGVNYSYEPLWVFGANNSERQPVWRFVELMVKANKYVEGRKLLPSELQDIEDRRFQAEKVKFKTMIQDDSEWMVTALVAGEAVSVPHSYDKSMQGEKKETSDGE